MTNRPILSPEEERGYEKGLKDGHETQASEQTAQLRRNVEGIGQDVERRAEPTDPVEHERAACAYLAECHTGLWDNATAEAIAEAIRRRGSEVDDFLIVSKKKAAADILLERCRQIEAEGWTPEHDDEHSQGEMAAAAGCYALFSNRYPNPGEPPPQWPWDHKWWKPSNYRRDMVKAGALMLADIDRWDRAACRAAALAEVERDCDFTPI